MACPKYTVTYLQGQDMTEPWAGESKRSYALCPPRTKSEQAEIQSWMPLRTWVKLWNVLYHIFENVVDCKQLGKLYDAAGFAEPNHFL
jgi:hypothetical protein